MNLQTWIQQSRHPYTERRFVGHPHECLAVFTYGLLVREASELYDLEDYRVSAVCGPFTELSPRQQGGE